MPASFHLAVALDGRDAPTAAVLRDRVAEAHAGSIDFVTLDDELLDPVLLAARIAPRTAGIGIVPAAVTTRTEPFLVSSAIATLDFVTEGRAGWLVRQSAPGRPDDDREAADHVEVVRRLWDSWEDDAIIRDAATSRFLDRERIHRIAFTGPSFAVLGPSITPRPPQGQPLVVAHAGEGAAAAADVVLVAEPPATRPALEPPATDPATGPTVEPPATDPATGPAADPGALPFADLAVAFDRTTVPDLTARLLALHAAGFAGARLTPADPDRDLPVIARDVTAALRAAGARRDRSDAPTLRGRLGLARPANRYATR